MRSETEGAPGGFLESVLLRDLPLHAWEALPLPVRVQDRLAEILVLVDELRSELHQEDARALDWMDEEVEAIGHSVVTLLDRLAC
ncbi:MAG TPA: hypothetical protein VEK11_24460 [Thermoanaerobaculia bacterium]|jgi:hypothetical protein|nr:hypothetical protein [Thermoanaerobaculia bacterium]